MKDKSELLESGESVDVGLSMGGVELGPVIVGLDVEHPEAVTSIKIIIEAITVNIGLCIQVLSIEHFNQFKAHSQKQIAYMN